MAVDFRSLGSTRLLTPVTLEVGDGQLRRVLLSLSLVVLATACLFLLISMVNLVHVSIVYLLPVLIAAIRWGMMPALVSAVGGVAAAAFFFYPPIYDLRVSNPQQLLELALFTCVAVVTSRLADSVRAHMKEQERAREEMRALYGFSQRLAVASTVGDIHDAIRDHLGAVLRYKIVLFRGGQENEPPVFLQGEREIPQSLQALIADAGRGKQGRTFCLDERTGSAWLVGAVSERHPTLGIIALDCGSPSADALDSLQHQVDAALCDAAATLERLGVARAIDEVKARASRERYREALIGSVSHELRTPLAAILGAATVLSQSEAIARDERISGLPDVIRSEAERLDCDIQNLLDSSRISSSDLRAQLAWTDPADLVNAAVERHRRRLSDHRLSIAVSDELPLVHVDPVLIGQALGQIIGNAAKYSPAGSVIAIEGRDEVKGVALCVSDQGMGLTTEEMRGLFRQFYRVPRHEAAAAGSGLGLWIARAFVSASGGHLTIESAGAGGGTTVTIRLPAPAATEREPDGDGGE